MRYNKVARLTVPTLLAAFLVQGCATNKGSINSFYEPSYTKGTVDTLAVPGIRNARLAPSESQQIGRRVNQAIASKNPGVELISANEFNRFINEEGLVGDYSDFIKDYVTSGIPNRVFLEKLEEEGIDAVMISELSNARQQDGAYGLAKGQSRITLSFTILNTTTNDVIWTASADGVKGTLTTLESAPPLVEAIQLAVEKIEGSVPLL